MGQFIQEATLPTLPEKSLILTETSEVIPSPTSGPTPYQTLLHPRNDITPLTHTMGASLPEYLRIKVHQSVLTRSYSSIVVMPAYTRHSSPPSSIPFTSEKRDKPFNWERPTARIDHDTDTLYIECFPGHDHVEHYAEIIAGYLRILEAQAEAQGGQTGLTHSSRVSYVPVSCSDTRRALVEGTNLGDFPGEGVDTVILGLVWHLSELTGAPGQEAKWEGDGPWQWVIRMFGERKVAFLGFRPAFWGDIAGEVVHYLASRLAAGGTLREVVYLGKLGVLRKGVRPNRWLATGGRSLVNGRVVEWENAFGEAVERVESARGCVIVGDHVTLGSVLHETKAWHAGLEGVVDFVDPEIGMMAQAAVRSGIRYGYLHMITDNLGQKYDEDLSNERTESVLSSRARLHRVVQDVMAYHLPRPL